MRRVTIGSGIIVLIALLAFTNMNTVFHAGHFESQFPPWGDGYDAPKIVVEDRTGLVAAMGAAIGDDAFEHATGTNLFLSWLGGCSDDLVSLTLYKFGDRYVVDKQTVSNGCGSQVGIPRNVVLTLRAPIDPAEVDFAAMEAAVR